MRLLFERAKTVAEPSGACAFAALLAGKVDAAGLRVGVTITGGNVTAARLRGARGLTAAALALVLASAALHAGWNALVAGAEDTHATTAVALVVGALVFAIPAALTWRIEAEAWPYIVASAALELAYFALLAAVYSRADYSFAYPVARGSAPVIVLLDLRHRARRARRRSPPRSACSRSRPASCSSAASAAPRRTRASLAARARRRRVHRRLHAQSTTTASATPPRCRTSRSCSCCPRCRTWRAVAVTPRPRRAARGRGPARACRRRRAWSAPTCSCSPRSSAPRPRPSPRCARRAS